MKNFILSLVIVSVFAACTSPKEKSLDQIKAMEATDSVFSPQAIESLKTAYLDFANKYPDDELAPEFIFKAAQRCNVSADHQQAISLFQSIIDKYPKSKLGEEAMFLQAYIYENSLQDYTKAKSVYTAFLAKYPNSELNEDARISIENLGKTPEEIIEGFKRKDSLS